MDDLSDVGISSVADNEVLAFNSGDSKWINQTAAEAGLSAAGHTHTASEVTNFYPEASGTVTYDALNDNGDVGTGATQVAQGDHGHTASDISDFNAAADARVTYEALDANSDVGDTANTVASGDHTHDIDDLGDVGLASVGDNEVLAFNSGTSKWINQTAAEAGLATDTHNHDGTYSPIIIVIR